jgi:hypothetical protein
MKPPPRNWLLPPLWIELFLVLPLSLAGVLRAAPTPARSVESAAIGVEPIDLRQTVTPSPLLDLRRSPGQIEISGHVRQTGLTQVTVRVTTSLGVSSQQHVPVTTAAFRCRYPGDFPKAPPLAPGALFVDTTTDLDFNISRLGHFQAELVLILHDGTGVGPDLPSAFLCDLLDRSGRIDMNCVEWPAIRALVNLYMRSRAAGLVQVGRPDFDLSSPADLCWFKNHLTLYEFDQCDRDWSKPLGNRLRRTFWQSVWNAWFNPSNNHPLDGNPTHAAWTNYLPYAFANDFADLLVLSWMRQHASTPLEDNLVSLCREATENLLAMQHHGTDNFALPDAHRRREQYTAGAFRYGMFENGEFLTEGIGWFYNTNHLDYVHGGVLNGRAVWALGEALRHDPHGPLVARLKDSIALALKFCLQDGLTSGYTKRTAPGHLYWRDPGEHAYLLLGMLAACEVAPDWSVPLAHSQQALPLRELCVQSLNALVDLEKPEHQWMIYPNVDAMAIAALAEGATLLAKEPAAARWRRCAENVAQAWLNARVDPKERTRPAVQFGLRVAPDRMTYIWPQHNRLQFFYYQDGHWIHALADLYALTGTPLYRQRAEAIVSYLCGNNPWQVRLLNELGGVYNWTDDTDRDGIEDLLKQDMYPESTAFCQIGIIRLIQSIARQNTRAAHSPYNERPP